MKLQFTQTDEVSFLYRVCVHVCVCVCVEDTVVFVQVEGEDNAFVLLC
jgi:hypothetical protein